jgi:hypothetical protein
MASEFERCVQSDSRFHVLLVLSADDDGLNVPVKTLVRYLPEVGGLTQQPQVQSMS